MTVIKDTGFEGTYAAEDFYDSSAAPAAIVTTRPYAGTQSLRSDVSGGPASPEGWSRWRFPTPPSTAAFRMYVNVDAWETNFEYSIVDIEQGSQVNGFDLRVKDVAGALSLGASWGSPTNNLSWVSISRDTWYRVEWKLDISATGWLATWGYAAGEAALTTVDTNAAGGNTFAASTLDWCLFGSSTNAGCVVYYDGVKFTNVGADYPLGGLVTLDSVLPDADVTTTGWSTAPLFSKVNDASDATVITATAA